LAGAARRRAGSPGVHFRTQAWICGRACTSAGLKITDSSSQIISMYFTALLRL
jgi:hypothetical protein